MHYLVTARLLPHQSEEMFEWLDQNRSCVEAVENQPLDKVLQYVAFGALYENADEGPWVVHFNQTDESALVFFKLKWC